MINNLNLRQRISKNWITIILALIILILGLKYYELKNEFNRINKNSVNKNSLIEELEDEKEDLEYEKKKLESENDNLENEKRNSEYNNY